MPNCQKRIALINDLTGFGRCSLTVQLPILSALGLQCCPVPTSILSNHCGFDHFFFDDYTSKLPAYLAEWRRLGLTFDGIYTGFLGSEAQIDLVLQFIDEFAAPNALILVDPVMGDDGVIPPPYDDALCQRMQQLIGSAHIITPNLTEAAKLCGLPYEANPDDETLALMGHKLIELGCQTAIITGIPHGDLVGNYIYRQNGTASWVWNALCGQRRVGTGDLFSSVLMGSLLQHSQPPNYTLPLDALEFAAQKAATFTQNALQYSLAHQIPVDDGIFFEPLLYQLTSVPKHNGGNHVFQI